MSSRPPEELAEDFEVEELALGERPGPNFNVAPTSAVYTVVERPGPRPLRQLRVMHWGLVPSWAKDPSGAARLMNARIETAADKPSFAAAFASRRAIVPADGYFEWRRRDGGGNQPFYLHRADGRQLALAGLYELWRDPARAPGHPGAWHWSVTILTTESTGKLRDIHDRTPMTVRRDRWNEWLRPAELPPAELRQHVVASTDELVARPVSPAVNRVRNNGPWLIEARAETAPTLF